MSDDALLAQLEIITQELGKLNRGIEKYLKIIEPTEEDLSPMNLYECFMCMCDVDIDLQHYRCADHGCSCLACGPCDECNNVTAQA